VPQSEPVLNISSAPVIATPAVGHVWPPAERKIFDKGPSVASRVEKPGDVTRDYWLDLSSFLDEGEVITGASAILSPVTTPELAITRLEYRSSSVIMWLSGGMDGQTYDVDVSINMGQESKVFRFAVRTAGDATVHQASVAEPVPAITCAGLGPLLTASIDHIAFPSTPSGDQSAPVTVTISNAGTQMAILAAIDAAAGLIVTSDTTGTVAPGESFTLFAVFAPTQAGVIGGFVSIVSNGPEISVTTLGEAL